MKITPVGMEIKRAYMSFMELDDNKTWWEAGYKKNEWTRLEIKASFLPVLKKMREFPWDLENKNGGMCGRQENKIKLRQAVLS